MKGLLRSMSTGVLAFAVAGAGFPSVLVAQAAENAPPVITSLVLVPAVASEDDTVQVDVTFTDPDVADLHAITIDWADGNPFRHTLSGGERTFFNTRRFFDDAPTNTPVDERQVTVSISDGVNPVASASGTLTLRNVAPVVTAFTVTPAAILDHQTVTADGSWVDPSRNDTYTVELDWGDRSATTRLALTGTQVRTFSAQHLYLFGGTFTVTATVTDDDTGAGQASATVEVTSVNTPPSALAVVPGAAVEGGTATLAATFIDPDAADTHTATVDWGDGTPPQSLALPAGLTSFSPAHVYRDSGVYSAVVTVADPAASTSPVTVVVNVANVAPTITSMTLSASSIVEQESVTVEVAFADPGASDTFTLTLSWGDGSSSSADLAAGVRAASATHQYVAVGSFSITASVTDGENPGVPMTRMLEVRSRNHAPSGLVLSATSPVEGSPATLSGSFTDLDASDAHTVSVAWGDGASGTLPLAAGVKSFSATHTYATDGTYRVTVTVRDPAGLAATAAVDLVVQNKESSNQAECDRLVALRHWLSDHASTISPQIRSFLERAIALLMAHLGCDVGSDDDDDD